MYSSCVFYNSLHCISLLVWDQEALMEVVKECSFFTLFEVYSGIFKVLVTSLKAAIFYQRGLKRGFFQDVLRCSIF